MLAHFCVKMSLMTAALILIDLQNAIEHPLWRTHGDRNNLDAEQNITTLLAAWRRSGRPIYHIRHDSLEPASPYRPGQTGNEFQPFAAPLPTEPVIPKQTNSAFIGTGLESTLRAAGHLTLIVGGIITNNSVEATVRMAGNLGFKTYLVADASYTFPRLDWHGHLRTAEEVHSLSLANLHGEYCTVQDSAETLHLFKSGIL